MVGGEVSRVQVPFERKGTWKVAPNDPRRPDGIVHQYCPPGHVESEMAGFSRLLMAYVYIKRNLPPPIVTAVAKPAYIAVLEEADKGVCRPSSTESRCCR